jgi:hypothetical protein
MVCGEKKGFEKQTEYLANKPQILLGEAAQNVNVQVATTVTKRKPAGHAP